MISRRSWEGSLPAEEGGEGVDLEGAGAEGLERDAGAVEELEVARDPIGVASG